MINERIESNDQMLIHAAQARRLERAYADVRMDNRNRSGSSDDKVASGRVCTVTSTPKSLSDGCIQRSRAQNRSGACVTKRMKRVGGWGKNVDNGLGRRFGSPIGVGTRGAASRPSKRAHDASGSGAAISDAGDLCFLREPERF